MFQLSRKLKLLKSVLRSINKNHFSDIHQRVEKERLDLLKLQKELFLGPEHDLVLAVKTQCKKLAELVEVEESFLRQKSRINWLKEGD